MKQRLLITKCLLAATIFTPFISRAQWLTSGGNIYNSNAGNVGIGTSSPTHLLHVNGEIYSQGTTWVNGNFILYGSINWQNNGTMACYGNKTINLNGNTWGFWNGKVGIGTTTPTEQLEVGGNISLTAAASRRIYMGGQAGGTFGLAYNSANPNYGIFYTEGTPDFVSIAPNGNATNGIVNVFGDGRVGIGTNTPAGPLDVNGQAKMTSAAVTTTLSVGTRATIGTVPPGSCSNAAITAGTAISTAVYGYSSDATAGTGVFGTGQKAGLYGVGGQLQVCPAGIFGNVGVAGDAYGTATGDPTGVAGTANGGSYAMGISGSAYSGTVGNYGVFGAVSGSGSGTPANWAGYFVGDVYSTTSTYASDRKLKSNIKSLTGAMNMIMALKPSSYTFKTNEYKQMNLPQGEHMGLIAQELEQVFPNLVRNNIQPEMKDKDGRVISEKVEFKCVNYNELIPVLIAAVQEQQSEIKSRDEEIQQLKDEIAAIKSAISHIATGTSDVSPSAAAQSRLEQSVPNPADSKARVTYHLADNVTNATIVLYATDGAEIRRYAVDQKGSGSITIDTASLANGTYVYSLITNIGIADTKKMIVAK